MADAALQPVGAWLKASFGQLRKRWATLSLLMLLGFVGMLLSVTFVYALGFVFFGFIQGWDTVTGTLADPRKLGIFLGESQGAVALFNVLAALVALEEGALDE